MSDKEKDFAHGYCVFKESTGQYLRADTRGQFTSNIALALFRSTADSAMAARDSQINRDTIARDGIKIRKVLISLCDMPEPMPDFLA